MAAPIAPLSSVDTVIRRGDQDDQRPIASPAAFNIHTKETIADDKIDELLFYNKRQTDLLEQFLTILLTETEHRHLLLPRPQILPKLASG